MRLRDVDTDNSSGSEEHVDGVLVRRKASGCLVNCCAAASLYLFYSDNSELKQTSSDMVHALVAAPMLLGYSTQRQKTVDTRWIHRTERG